ncbi:aminopeptidase P family protein [Antarcticibacterium flavum]|uniref:Aminopeptidase P family protein n=1 Tax=Antarcticibacterium flavum TaxID=2058175 RepID=A0A5B7X6K8_9FLAO|nr:MULTISPECIES: M24 family metallopeptidase [Antarcticibacterium]MCM4159810.1 peptidase M24 [Antarcticibacterium sp. W02-3]QCY70735.1 aminopeptidase P family protein [Antarcticibacterium flavum]
MRKYLLLLLPFMLLSCEIATKAEAKVQDPEISFEENLWPEIRKKRIKELLPDALKEAGVDAWMIVCRENNNDPLADHIGGENAGGTAAFLFYRENEEMKSVVFSPEGEAMALAELGIHDRVEPVERGKSALEEAVAFLKENNLNTLAVNSSDNNSLADGLSYTQRSSLEEFTKGTAINLVSADEVVYHWLSLKLPEEVEIMRKAATLTAAWQEEAYNMVVPGETTDADVARFLKQKMKEHGVKDAWHPDQNPNVNSGVDRGHSHATNKVIQQGDVIQTDFGIKVHDRWVTDIQRFAYVLKEGETTAPEDIQHYWESAKRGNRVAKEAMKPGVKGVDVDGAQREVMEEAGSSYVMWSTGHPVGYVAHDVGPNLGGSQSTHVRPDSNKTLKEGMTFAFDGFHSWELPTGGMKTISVEEMVVITKDGAEYLTAPQEELVLIE